MRQAFALICLAVLSLCGRSQAKGYVQVRLPLQQLPQDHDYQKQLRGFMATLTEKDFEIGRAHV